MCSAGSCDVAGLIGGPVGSLVGMGIKALVNGAAIGPRADGNLLPKKQPTEQEGIKQFYDNVETHLKGMLQVLEPAMEIKKMLSGECKSADRDRPAICSQAKIQYYSPQIHPQKCCAAKKSCGSSVEKSTLKTSTSRGSSRMLEKTAEKTSCLKSSGKSVGSSSYKSCCGSSKKEKEKTAKPSGKIFKSKRAKNCCLCDVSLEENIVLAVLPCEHAFCYTCLAAGNGKHCRKCDKSYDMKNVSQIFH